MNSTQMVNGSEGRGPRIVVVDDQPLNPASILFKMDLRKHYGPQTVRFCLPKNNPTEFIDRQFGGCMLYVFNNDVEEIAKFFASPEVSSLPITKVLAIDGSKNFSEIGDVGQDDTLFFYPEFKSGELNVRFRQSIGFAAHEEPPIAGDRINEPIRPVMARKVRAWRDNRNPVSDIDPEIAEIYTQDVQRFEKGLTSHAMRCDVQGWSAKTKLIFD